MKKKLFIVMLSAMVLATGCSNKSASNQDVSTESKETADTSEESTEETTEAETSTEVASEVMTLSIAEFDELLAEQPISVISTEYVVQDENYKSLYPDMLSTVIRNNTDADIKDAVLAIVAWDSNNLPVKIEGQMSFTGGEYFNKVNYGDINLAAGGTFGEESGLSLSENCQISTFKSIVLSFTTFDGDTWENPYADSFQEAYEGKKYSDDITIEVETKDTEFAKSDAPSNNKVELASEDELSAALGEQPMYVSSTDYVVQDQNYKSLYPDMLQAILQNNSEEDIKDAVVAFVAWDENGLPVKIKGSLSFNDPAYVTKVSFDDINMIPGSSFGESNGYQIDENCDINSFKAIVVSYTTFEGEKWENPLFRDFCDLYEGKRLSE